MEDLIISLEREGVLRPVGRIVGNNSSDSCFAYSDNYLKSESAAPISLSLPLQTEPFSPAQTRNFFEGLLPEGFTRRNLAQWMHVAEGDYLSLLHGLGRECLGALCVSVPGEAVSASYSRITEDEVRQLAAEGASKSAELVLKSHLSLTGASGKVGLYYDSKSSAWYLPQGTAPSTHIVKQSHVRLDGIVTNEQLSLLTAARCGIEIADSFIIDTGHGEDAEVLFATRRYDRRFAADSKLVDGLPCPLRLHQEDFAQAMGIPADEKYEKEPRGYLRAMFDLLRRYSADPITDQLKLWDIVVFNFLIGNTDSHIKNFSLLYSPNQRAVRLAPAYDIVSTAVYPESTREMAFFIGDALSLDDLTRDSFRIAAREIGLGERMAMRRFDAMCGKFVPALRASAAALSAEGFPKALELERLILETGGMKTVIKTV